MNLLFFKINNLNITSVSSNSVLQACFSASIDIPRFCYHEGLRIAGNCRMCLVEVSSSKKLVASCATPLVSGLDIKTTTLRVKRARQSVLEFLLINHPLDCPICDQGGECDLQDITLIFGGDRGRFFEISKRSVFDKNLGPLIKTIMNRCIHCTRCVRFFSEINQLNLLQTKVPLLGLFGRGSQTEVGTYIPQIFLNEFSGNVIDLCPVGALTSKPFSFKARSWELSAAFTFDVLDNMIPRIRLDMSGSNILRVLPYSDINNFSWISNKSRYYFDFLELNKEDSSFLNLTLNNFSIKSVKINLEDSLHIFTNFFLLHLNHNILNLFGSVISIESFFMFKEFFLTQGLSKLYLDTVFLNSKKLHAIKGKSIFDFRHTFSLIFTEKILFSNLWVLLNIGLNLRIEAPLLFLQILKLIKLKQIHLLTFNALNYNNIYKIQNQTNISLLYLVKFLEGRVIQNRLFYKYFIFYKCLIFLPKANTNNINNLMEVLDYLKEKIFNIFKNKYIFLNENNDSLNFFVTGVIQKHISNLTLYEVGMPYLPLNLLGNKFKKENLIIAYDTSNYVSTKLFKFFKKFNIKTTSILLSMNTYDTTLINKYNLIIPTANLYQMKESFLNLFLETKVLNKINSSNLFDISTIFQAITSFIFLKYNSKFMVFYNSFFFSQIFENFKKLRDVYFFKNIINTFFLAKLSSPLTKHSFKSFMFIYISFIWLRTVQKKINLIVNINVNYILQPNSLNFYTDIRSDVFNTSKVILKSSSSFKKEYNFTSFSLSI